MADQSLSSSSGSSPARQPRRRRRRVGRVILTIFKVLGTLLLIGVITCALLACFGAVYLKNVILPQTTFDLGAYPINLSSTIYYVDQETDAEFEYETLHGDQDRVWVEYGDIPKNLINATVAIEDRRFYDHHGVDWIRTAKSVLTMFTGGKIQGGSTITQQLIKNSTQYDDITVKRKIIEIFRALEFDKRYSKSQTLEYYLNYIFFGRKCYGVYTASYKYFGKPVTELDLAECASLISITNNPSLYDPYTHLDKNTMRRRLVLDAMLRDGYITEQECKAAKVEVIDFHQGHRDGQESPLYSWYTEQVITDVTNDLISQYGYSETVAKDLVYSGGLQIYACVDPRVQNAVDTVYSNVDNLPYTSPSGQQLQSAITVIDPKGNVVALAGKLGEKTSEDTRGFNMATRALRQPGSSIKPLAVYAPALEMGLITPYTVIEDSPSIMLRNDVPWPSNVDRRYRGQVTINDAVTNSYNTTAVRVLQAVTPSVGFEYLVDKFGVDIKHFVLNQVINGEVFDDRDYSPLALGGMSKGLTTLDMASAYSVFPRNGIYLAPRTYSKVLDVNGKTILTRSSIAEPVLKETTVHYMNEMLKRVVTNGSGTSAAIPGITVAGKTGTTTSYKDRWFVGYTSYYTAAVWVGYRSPEVITGPSSLAPGLWNKVMTLVHDGLEDKPLPTLDGLIEVEYCRDTGKLTTEACYSDIRGNRAAVGYFFPEDVPMDYCEAHVMVEVCTADPILNNEGTPTGRYHLAGEFCPEVVTNEDGTDTLGRISISVLDMERQYVGTRAPEDDVYFLTALEREGPCAVHLEAPPIAEPVPYDPSIFDITNPSTWPTAEQDPNFDPGDASTWPVNQPPIPPIGEGNGSGAEGDDPPVFTPPDVPQQPLETPPASEETTAPFIPPAGA